MIRGTTPTLTFTLPFQTDIIRSLMLTFYQCNREVFTLTKEDCVLEENTVTVNLDQAHTLMFVNNAFVEIQMRILTTDDAAIASEIVKTTVDRILKDGEIK